MNTPVKEQDLSIKETMAHIGKAAKEAARTLAVTTTEQKNESLNNMAEAILASTKDIITANKLDIEAARKNGRDEAFIDRLMLDEKRISSISEALVSIAALPDPVGEITDDWSRPNGLHISRIRTPLGVIGIIYESRPNVTADAGGLCLKAGNAAILRGGSDGHESSTAIHHAIRAGLKSAGLPETAIQLVPTRDRAAVGEMLAGLEGAIDVIVPRGGKSLVARVEKEARVPVFSHLEGICHVYVDSSAKPEMAVEVTVNAKMRRTGICGAAETLLLDADLQRSVKIAIIDGLIKAGCTIRADEKTANLNEHITRATNEDWQTEYLSNIISVKEVEGVKGAIAHIQQYSSNHTEAIISEDMNAVEAFFREVDSAILMHNASTQFADGGEFGMGAEIGIATGKMHARGPVGVEQLTSFKYLVRGHGQTRPL